MAEKGLLKKLGCSETPNLVSSHPLKPCEGSCRGQRSLWCWGPVLAPGLCSLPEETHGRERNQTTKGRSTVLIASAPWSRTEGYREGAGLEGPFVHSHTAPSNMLQEMSSTITKELATPPSQGEAPGRWGDRGLQMGS